MIFDYATLKVIWWCFIGGIIIVFALTDGWDLGIGMLSPFLGKSDDERRIILRSVEPNWEGNQTWLVIAGGVIFAAWPLVYAASFSGMYVAMLLVLFALFFRPVGFKYRNKLEEPRWRTAWDWGLFIGGFVPMLVFGIAFGNLLQGVPFHFDADLRPHYTGSFWQLLNPFALLAGVTSVALFAMHGAAYLCLRVDGVIQARAARTAKMAGIVLVVAFAAAGVWVAMGIDGYRITMIPDLNGQPNPPGQGGGEGAGRVARQLRQVPLDDRGAACRLRRRVRRDRLGTCTTLGDHAIGERGGRDRCHPHRRFVHVSVRHAVLVQSRQQPHRVGFGVELAHAADHVLGHRVLRAADRPLYELGVREAARHDHARNDPFGVLTCGISRGFSDWAWHSRSASST